MSQRYFDNTKRPKLKENQLVILKIYAFCQIIYRRASGPGESAAGVTIYENTPGNVAASFPQTLTELDYRSHMVKIGVDATC